MATGRKPRKEDIYNKYRRLLEMPNLTKSEIDEMRRHVILLAQTICEHVWGKDFY
jgi:hypothetical protein